MAHKTITRSSQVPTTAHWAVIEDNSIYVPGDQRSNESPGHGYPAENVNYVAYHAFDTEAELIEWVSMRQRYAKDYTVLYVEPKTIKQSFSIG